jgi:hypothetical protein
MKRKTPDGHKRFSDQKKTIFDRGECRETARVRRKAKYFAVLRDLFP